MSPDFSRILDDLELEWNRTCEVDLAAFLSGRFPEQKWDASLSPEFTEFLAEAVRVDMERRGTATTSVSKWTLEDYQQNFPILFRDDLSRELQLWHDRVTRVMKTRLVDDSDSFRTAIVPESSHLAVGESFDAYQIVREIGHGGMGTVYEAVHQLLGKRVALKLISRKVAGDRSVAERFRREIRASGKVDHPHIVRATDAGEFRGTLFLVMEYVEGMDLGKLVKDQGPRSVSETLSIARQAATALETAHAAGIIHRDIKPSNLLISAQGHVKLLDLGLARLVGESAGDATSTGIVLGTPDFMAPEQWGDIRQVDARADIYSLGCTLYYLLTGRAPYGGEQHSSYASKMKAHLYGAIPEIPLTLPDKDRSVNRLLTRMLAKKPEDRFASSAELRCEIEEIERSRYGKNRSEEGIADTVPLGTLPSRQRSNSNRWRIAMGTLVITLITVGGWWLSSILSTSRIPDNSSTAKTDVEDRQPVAPHSSGLAATPAPPTIPIPQGRSLHPHREFTQLAVHRKNEVSVFTGGKDSGFGGEPVTSEQAIPTGDLLLASFADSPEWTDEDWNRCRSIHYLFRLQWHGSRTAPAAAHKLRDMDTTVEYLHVGKYELHLLDGCLRCTHLHVDSSVEDVAWPESLGEQPQLRHLSIPADGGDSLLRLISHNTHITTLQLTHVQSDTTPQGIRELSHLQSLHTLRFDSSDSIDHLLPEIGRLSRLCVLDIQQANATDAALSELQKTRPDLWIIHPRVSSSDSARQAVFALRNAGCTIDCLPGIQNRSDQSSFEVHRIQTPNLPLYLLDGAMKDLVPEQLHLMNFAECDLDELTQQLRGQRRLQQFYITGTSKRITRKTMENLASLDSLTWVAFDIAQSASCAPLRGADLEPLRSMPELNLLQLPNSQVIEDDSLKVIGECPSLNRLQFILSPNASAEGMAHLQKLTRLVNVVLICNDINDSVLLELGRIPSLRLLNLRYCQGMTEQGLNQLQTALPKCAILLADRILLPLDAR